MFLAWIHIQGPMPRASVWISEVTPFAVGDAAKPTFQFSDGTIRTAWDFERPFQTRAEAVDYCVEQIREAAVRLLAQSDELAAKEGTPCAATT